MGCGIGVTLTVPRPRLSPLSNNGEEGLSWLPDLSSTDVADEHFLRDLLTFPARIIRVVLFALARLLAPAAGEPPLLLRKQERAHAHRGFAFGNAL
jgi:hypothetical protein